MDDDDNGDHHDFHENQMRQMHHSLQQEQPQDFSSHTFKHVGGSENDSSTNTFCIRRPSQGSLVALSREPPISSSSSSINISTTTMMNVHRHGVYYPEAPDSNANRNTTQHHCGTMVFRGATTTLPNMEAKLQARDTSALYGTIVHRGTLFYLERIR
jgi:hypothetical protein